MNILFLSLSQFDSIGQRGIYPDLLREFSKNGHAVYAVSPLERRLGRKTELVRDELATVLRLRVGNIRKVRSKIEKGISTVLLGWLFKRGIRKYFSDIRFDLVLFPTPPISLLGPVKYVKKRDRAFCYLMLKDIFPQNSVDIGILRKNSMIYRYFRRKEKAFYSVADRIGCMSRANADYLLEHNPELLPEKAEICPNCIEVQDLLLTGDEKAQMRKKYGIPQDKNVYVYGGNLGKPQGIPFLMDCLRVCRQKEAFFLLIGDGTESEKLKAFAEREKLPHVRFMDRLPKDDYDRMIASCDVGLIFLDHRFTIPNFPSRLLSYLQAGLPVLACTDPHTDVGKVITDGGFGWWCESDRADRFAATIEEIEKTDSLSGMGEKGLAYLRTHYTAENAYRIIVEAVNG